MTTVPDLPPWLRLLSSAGSSVCEEELGNQACSSSCEIWKLLILWQESGGSSNKTNQMHSSDETPNWIRASPAVCSKLIRWGWSLGPPSPTVTLRIRTGQGQSRACSSTRFLPRLVLPKEVWDGAVVSPPCHGGPKYYGLGRLNKETFYIFLILDARKKASRSFRWPLCFRPSS